MLWIVQGYDHFMDITVEYVRLLALQVYRLEGVVLLIDLIGSATAEVQQA